MLLPVFAAVQLAHHGPLAPEVEREELFPGGKRTFEVPLSFPRTLMRTCCNLGRLSLKCKLTDGPGITSIVLPSDKDLHFGLTGATQVAVAADISV